jgi:hypothetical protein
MPFDPNKYLQEKAQSAAPAFDPDKYLSEKLAPPPESRMLEAGIEGVGKGATFGLLPYAQAATEKVITKGANLAGMNLTDSPMSELVRQYRERGAGLREQHPAITLTGEIAGGFAPGAAISKGVAMAGSKFLPPAMQNIGMTKNFSQAGPMVPQLNTLGKVAKLGTEGAVMGAAYTPDEGADFNRRVEQAKFGGLVGTALPAAGAAIKGGANLVGKGITKGFSALTGVDENIVKEFYADPNKFLNAQTREQVVENMQKVINKVHDDVERGVMSVDDAKLALREMQNTLKQTRGEATKVAREALRQSEQNLDSAFKTTVNELKAKPAPTSLQPEISGAIKTLGDDVSAQSGKAFDILENEKVKVPAYDAYTWLGKTIDKLKSGPPSDSANAAITKLETYRNYLGPKAELSGPQAKELIMAIDSDVRQWEKIFGRGNQKDNLLRQFRGEIDAPLKRASENYAKAMEPLAKDTTLLKTSQKAYGSPDKALSKLSSIASPKSVENQKLLNELGARTGRDFNSPIQDFISTQRLLKSPERLNTVKQGLPQYAERQSALAQAAKGKRASDPREIQRLTKNSIENRSLNVAKESLEKAQRTKADLSGWSRLNTSKKINSVMRNMDDPAVKKQVETLSKLGDQDFADQINRLRVNKGFTGSRMNGSRNVNFWALMGMGTAGGGPVGGMIGASTGYIMDKYGPALAKKVLVAVHKTQGTPTVQKLIKAGISSQKVAQELVDDFAKAVGVPAQSLNADAISRRLIGSQQEDETYASKE